MNHHSNSERVLELLSEGKFDQVIKLCEEHSSGDPQLLEYYAMAECHQGNLEKSKTIFLNAIALDPNNTNLLYNYSEVLSDLGSHASTRDVLSKILALDPEHSAAKLKAERLNSLSQQNKEKHLEIDQTIQNLERSINPLQAAFHSNEVNESKKNIQERERKIKLQKIHQRPKLPTLDREVLADERLLAAEDALREGHPEIALKLATQASLMNANKNRVYAIAGDSYLKLGKYNYGHLSYLLALQYGELDLQRQINLLSLCNTIGDSILLDARKEAMIKDLGESSLMQETINKIINQSKSDQHVVYHPEKGPISSSLKGELT